MNSPLASNGSFCGGNAADLQSKFPKTLSEQAKAQGISRSGIYEEYTIALVRKVTFATKDIKPPCEIPKPQSGFALKNAQFVARFCSFDYANTTVWCLLRSE